MYVIVYSLSAIIYVLTRSVNMFWWLFVLYSWVFLRLNFSASNERWWKGRILIWDNLPYTLIALLIALGKEQTFAVSTVSYWSAFCGFQVEITNLRIVIKDFLSFHDCKLLNKPLGQLGYNYTKINWVIAREVHYIFSCWLKTLIDFLQPEYNY